MVERAKKYAELHSRGWSGENKKAVYDKAYKEYIKIAEEQKKADIDKACKWLTGYVGIDASMRYISVTHLIEDFRKAMEI